MTSKVEQKERTHDAILESAARIVREKGIAAAGVAEVMRGAGLTVGGFYAHFASKSALVDEAMRRTAAALTDMLFSRLEDKPVADRIVVVLKRYLSAAHRDLHTQGCVMPAVAGEIGTTAPEHRGFVRDQIELIAAGLARELPRDARRDRALSPRHLALGLFALMYGGLALSRALGPTPLSDEMLKACRALGTLAARGDGRK